MDGRGLESVVEDNAMARGERYEQAARRIAGYLAARQGEDGSFPGPDYYGAAFSLWLWLHFPDEFAGQAERAWQRVQAAPPQEHGEFNAYALLHCRERLGPAQVDEVLRRIPFGRRHSANWMLLRAACASMPGPYGSRVLSGLEGRVALLCHKRGCFIHDRPKVRSFAYHAFCGALLADMWRARGTKWAGVAAARAAAAIAPFILPNGDALYVGRGQEQIFGYGALLYLLESAAQLTGRPEFATQAERVLDFLLHFQRSDGSFPLVLLAGEPEEPWRPDAYRPGWYTYNRYADYLPFLGCLLLKAANPDLRPVGRLGAVRKRPWLEVVKKDRYVAVLSGPGGATTNDLAFPYACVDGESLFPCYGGEGARVKPEAMPLPHGVLRGGRPYSFREQLSYRLRGADLIGVSPLVRHERHFVFGEKGFSCHDDIIFRGRASFTSFVPANFLFRSLHPSGEGDFETWHGNVKARVRLVPEGRSVPAAATTASGMLAALRCTRGAFEARPGETISTELRVWFV